MPVSSTHWPSAGVWVRPPAAGQLGLIDEGAARAERLGVPVERIVTTWPLVRLREREQASALQCQRDEVVGRVLALRPGVDLDSDPVRGARIEHGAGIERRTRSCGWRRRR
jgi:hypothetical protein